MNKKLLTITFAKLLPDFTWVPRTINKTVDDSYAQNITQAKETACLFADSDEIVYDVSMKNIWEPTVHLMANIDFQVDFYSAENKKVTKVFKKGYRFYDIFEEICLVTDALGYIVDHDSFLMRYTNNDSHEWFVDVWVPTKNFSAIIFNEKDEVVEVPMP